MIPLATLLQLLVATWCLTRATYVLAGQPLPVWLQVGLLVVCAGYAAVEAHWSWSVQQGQRFHAALWRGALLPREQVQDSVTKEPTP